ncbi:MAG: hypothetical protein ACI9VS_001770 [Candidatus Binatia bacterium]|jgi:hypothetical protein
MNSTTQITRAQDELSAEERERVREPLSTGLYCGDWLNTDEQSAGVRRVEFRSGENGEALMRVFGAGESGLIDWGQTEIDVLADSVNSNEGAKFRVVFDHEFVEVRMHGWVKLGVLVIAFFNRFKDDSGRTDYFDREFFALVD